LPLVFLLALSVYTSFCTNTWLIQVLFLVLLIFQFSYFKSLYYFWNRPDLYNEADMKTNRSYASFLTIFFLASNIFGLQSLLNFPVWPMLTLFVILSGSLIYFNWRFENQEIKIAKQFSLLLVLIISQSASAFVFLPLNYNVSGLAVAIVFYLSSNLIYLYLQNSLTSKKIKSYLILSSAGLVALLLTANWLN